MQVMSSNLSRLLDITLPETVTGAAAASYVGPKNTGLTSTKMEKLKNMPPIDEILKEGSKYTIDADEEEEEEKADKEEGS